MSNGVKSVDLPESFVLDEVIGHVTEGEVRRSRRQKVANLASQLLASGAIANAVADIHDQIDGLSLNADSITVATWSKLSALAGTREGQLGEVTGPDAGTHTDPVVGGSKANLGIYSWSPSPAGWQWLRARGQDYETGIYLLAAQTITINWSAKTIVTNAQTGYVQAADMLVSIPGSQNVSFTAATATAAAWLYADKTSGALNIVQAPAGSPPKNSVVLAQIFSRQLHSFSPYDAITLVDDNGVSHKRYSDRMIVADYLSPGGRITVNLQAGTLTTDPAPGYATIDSVLRTVPGSQNVAISTSNPTSLRWLLVNKLTGALSVVVYPTAAPDFSLNALIAYIYNERVYVATSYANILLVTSGGVTLGYEFDAAAYRFLLPPKLHLFAATPRRLYASSMLAGNNETVISRLEFNLRKAKSGDIDTDVGFTRNILLDPAELGATIQVGMRSPDQPDKRYIKAMEIEVAPPLTGKTVNFLQFGDSLGEDGLATEIKAALLAKGASGATPVGTYQSGITDGLYGEARGYWSYRKVIGKDNYSTGIGSHTRSVTGSTTTKFQNPYLKPADAGDKASYPDLCFRFTGALDELSYTDDPDKTGNFYIFDFGWYMSEHAVATPDVIYICYARNDINLDRGAYSNAERLSFMRQGLALMLDKIRAWHATKPIVVCPSYAESATAAGGVNWAGETATWIENCITDVAARADPNIHICGAWPTMSREWVFPYSASSALSAVNNEAVKTITDVVHPDAATSPYYGLRQMAYSIAATMACAVP